MRLFALFFLLAMATQIAPAHADDLQDGLAITNTDVLKALEMKGFALPDLVQGEAVGIQRNGSLYKNAMIKPVFDTVINEVATYKATAKTDGRTFDTSYLTNDSARFALVGVINRMDLGYKSGSRCGEVRFVYRLAYTVTDKDATVMSRLPMTINFVLNPSGNCVDLANAWLKIKPATATADELVNGGPLDSRFIDRKKVKDLEINLQMVRFAASGAPDFGGKALYLLRVFKLAGGKFAPSVLENEIDREKLLAQPALMAELKGWILSHVKDIDSGAFLLPEKFLATRAISIAPGGIGRSSNRMYFGFFKSDELSHVKYSELDLVKSQAGLERRLNDSTCVGCHQTRAIGGFHFTGRDPFGRYPGNSVFLPGSAHFMGDLPRRRAILEDVASQKAAIDSSRGFSSRPQERRSHTILKTGLTNGWGAHCSLGKDPSFASWTCGTGLACHALSDKDSGLGICLSTAGQQVGDPCEFGKITTAGFGSEKYVRTEKRIVTVANGMCSPQSQDPGTRTGGFLNGNVRTLSCENLPSEAACGLLPASKPGFNQCIGRHNFGDCLKTYSMGVGMRGCDQLNPCRDDYICAESLEDKRGVCISPYFLFQFRVDGHPRGT